MCFCFLVFRMIERCSWVFFFSSRRRHTRWTGDWSSDVCSSDLDRALLGAVRADLLEVLVEHRVAQEVTELGGVGEGGGDRRFLALGLGVGVGPVRGLHHARVGVGGVGVLVLLGEAAAAVV